MSTTHDRVDIRIPKNSELYEYLYVDTTEAHIANWVKMERLLKIAQIREEEILHEIWLDFEERILRIRPELTTKIEMLRPLIFRRFLRNDQLSEDYYDDLRKL
jgi:hypothetical protein